MADLREWLKKNKIFFEVFVATALSFMALFVSIKSNQIAKNQTKIMELENTPRIEIRKNQVYNDSLKVFDVTKWFIFNNNSKISNFDIEDDISFVEFVRRENFDTTRIPLKFFLNLGGTLHGNSEGLIYEFDNKYSGYYAFLTTREIMDLGFLDIITYIELTYKNVLGIQERKYFKIYPSIYEVNSAKWNKEKAYWENNIFKSVSFEKDIKDNIKRIVNFRK